ncbi:MAG: type II secretion system protein GspM [Desulfobacteraceae bacterium]|nr:type II secretion system protein GspM [Desulfobacteraceae bacterium]
MIRLPDLKNLKERLGTRPLLIGVAAFLVGLNLLRLGYGFYENKKEAIHARQELLARQQASLGQLPELRSRVAALERRKKAFEDVLFTGSSEEEIASAMQIMIQQQLVRAGLEPESLRPMPNGDAKGKAFGEISIKVRSGGTLNQFVAFLANLYRSRQLFLVEGFTLKPFQNEVKIFIDFKGYYKLA